MSSYIRFALLVVLVVYSINSYALSQGGDIISQPMMRSVNLQQQDYVQQKINLGIPDLNFKTWLTSDTELDYSHDVLSLFKEDFDEIIIGGFRHKTNDYLFKVKIVVFRLNFPAYAPSVCPIVFEQLKFNIDKRQLRESSFFRSDLTGYAPEPGQQNRARIVCVSRGAYVIAFIGQYASLQEEVLALAQQEADTFFDKLEFEKEIDDQAQFNSPYFQTKTFNYGGSQLNLRFPPKWRIITSPTPSDVPFLRGRANTLAYGAGLKLANESGDSNTYATLGIFVMKREATISVFQDYIQKKVEELSKLWSSNTFIPIWVSSFSDSRLDELQIANQTALYRLLFTSGGEIGRSLLFSAQDENSDYILASYASQYYGFFNDRVYQYAYISSQTAEHLVIHDLGNFIIMNRK